MLTRIGDMRSREVISVRDGESIFYIGYIEIYTESASLAAIVVYGRARFFGLFGHEADCVIPWSDITTIGEDAVLVDYAAPKRTQKRGFLANFFENG